jgi:hypothetical protein
MDPSKKEQVITLGDLLTIKEFNDFQPQRPILRLPNSNYFELKGTTYELRLFAFFMKTPEEKVNTFGDFVRTKNLENTKLARYSGLIHVSPLSYSIIDNEGYINIAILEKN